MEGVEKIVKVGIGEQIIVARAPPWSKRGGLVIKRNGGINSFSEGSPAQKKAMLELAEAAHGAYGKKGRMAVANHVQATVKSGEGVHGGETRAARAERLHREAAGRISSYRNRA